MSVIISTNTIQSELECIIFSFPVMIHSLPFWICTTTLGANVNGRNGKWKRKAETKETFEVSGNVEMVVTPPLTPHALLQLERYAIPSVFTCFVHIKTCSTSCWYGKDRSSSTSLVKFVSLHTLDALFGGFFQRWTLQRYVLFMPDFGSMFQVDFVMHTGSQCRITTIGN